MKALAVFLLAVVTGLRLWAASVLPVTPGEAYHWMGSERLDWAFFDGPGGTAALVHLCSQLLGDGPLGLRLAFPLLAVAASIGIYLLGRAWFGPTAGLWAACALNALPAFNLAAAHAGPEIPTLAGAILALGAFTRATERGPAWWALFGLLTALAAQFSYAALAILPGVALAVTASPRLRAEWRRPGIYAGFTLALVGAVPAFWWNHIHGWPATALGTWQTELSPRWGEAGAALLASGAALSIPAIAAGSFAIFSLARAARLHVKPRIILALTAPFFLAWLRGVLQGEPPPSALLAGAAVIVTGAAGIFSESPARCRLGALALVLTAATTAFLPRTTKIDPWADIATSLAPLLAAAPIPHAAPLFLIAPDPAATAALSYHLARAIPGRERPLVFLRESQDLSNQFGLWPRYDDFVTTDKAPDEFFKELKAENPYLGRSALYLSEEEPADLPQTITSAFARVTPYATLALPDDRKLRVYLCEDYQTMPL